MLALKLLPQLLCFAATTLVLLRAFPGRRPATASLALAGFAAGVIGVALLTRGSLLFGIVRGFLGGGFLLLWGVSVIALYRSNRRLDSAGTPTRWLNRPLPAAAIVLCCSLVAGAICACRLPAADGSQWLPPLLLVLAGVLLVGVALAAERSLSPLIAVSPEGLLAAMVALGLFASSFMIRLDLFSPLSMKVMKGTHDFVHQFMESILIPDHVFVRQAIWGYIGVLFSKDVGFWGGMVIWFAPALLVLLAIRFQPLPTVAHIRQGAQRRKTLAQAMQERNLRLVVPALALAVFAAAAYQSRYPTVEYWDPKPLQLTASATGEIFIPRKGEVDLEDGKLHKYLYKQAGREARFFVLMTPAGKLTVDLDACAICKPDGYGQAEGTVICYYCKTLIPLETVGMPGGCNPVPVAFADKPDGVHLNAASLLNSWSQTIQSTSGTKGGGK